jgi:prophage endopeptidase
VILRDLIPAPYRIAVELALLAAALVVAGACGAMVMHWKDGATIATLKAQHAQAIATAAAATLAAQQKADADHEKLAGELAAQAASFHEALTRNEHANDLLRADVAAGTRVVRIAASCPARTGDVPQAAGSGKLDPGAGAVLDAATGQRVLDLRASTIRADSKLAACQAAVKRMTQGTP